MPRRYAAPAHLEPFRSDLHSRGPVHPNAPAGGCGPGYSRSAGPLGQEGVAGPLPHTESPAGRHYDWQAGLAHVDFTERVSAVWTGLLKREGIETSISQPREIDMLRMLSHDGAVERGQLARGLKGKYVIRAEGATDAGPGNFFNGPFDSLADAKTAAERLASSETRLRQGNAVPRTWPDGTQRGAARGEVVRVYQIQYDAPGIISVAASQPESGTVMLRPEHLEAVKKGQPSIAHEYKGGNNQLELPVTGVRKSYNVEIVTRVGGAEYRVKPDGTGF
jgi:hypothetical protein